MNRPIIIATIGLIIGIIGELYLQSIVLFILAILIIVIKSTKVKVSNRVLIIIIIATIIGYGRVYIKDKSLKRCNGITKFEATVISNIKTSDYKDEYIIKLEGKKVNLLLRVDKKNKDIKYGTLINVEGEFEEPTGQRNYKGYSYKKYLYSNNIAGIVKGNKVTVLKDKNLSKYKMNVNELGIRTREKIKKFLSKDTEDLFISLILADKSNLSEDIEQDFINSNLSHILAVSGMHVSYIMTISLMILNIAINKRTTKGIIAMMLMVYMQITGYIPSVVRASIMLIMALIADILFVERDTYNSFGIAIIINLIVNPFTIYNLGFQFSCLGTLGILLFQKKIKEKLNCKKTEETMPTEGVIRNNNKKSFIRSKTERIIAKIKEIVAVSISANILIIPISILNFNNIPINFLLSNILATPLISVVLMLGIVVIVISFINIKIAIIFGKVLELFIKMLMNLTKIMSKIPNIKVITPSIICVVIYFLILILYKKIKNNKKILVAIILIVLIFSIRVNFGLKIHFVDVGQGDCTYVEMDKKKILIDGGGSEKSNYDVGEKVVIPYLLDRGTRKLDYIMVSHFDSDHVGGIISVIKSLKVKNIIISKQHEVTDNYKELINISKRKRINIIEVERGDRVRIIKDGYIDIIWPDEKNIITQNWINNNSIVAKLCYKNFKMLFCGDIEEIAEKKILNQENNLKADIIKIAHHGSKSSSTQEFLEKVNGEIAVIGVGKSNTFGHPNSDVIERLKKLKYQVFRTDLNGEISIIVKNKCIKMSKKINTNEK